MTNTRPHVVSGGYYSLTDTALHLAVHRSTIYRWIKCGYMKTRRSKLNGRKYVPGGEIVKIYDALCGR